MPSLDDVAKPLLIDLDTAYLDSPTKDATIVSLRALEDGDDDFETVDPRSRCSIIERLLMAVRRRNVRLNKDEGFDRVRFPGDEKKKNARREWRLRSGIVHIADVFMGLVNLIKDDSIAHSPEWLPLQQYQNGDYTGLTRNVKPIHCHSHNDYWRRVPLYEALRWGCTGVEADVWLFDSELFVGHSTRDLTADRTFRSMYVDPLVRILDQRNLINRPFETSPPPSKSGVFEADPNQTLVLLVDFKNDGHAIYPFVSEQLEPLRKKGYLSYYDGKALVSGPITIVATGNAPFDLVTANTTTRRDIFFDAPLDHLVPSSAAPKRHGQGTVGIDATSHFDLTNSYYASVDFKKAIGWCWFGRISAAQLQAIRTQIRGAKDRGLKSRYWGAPKWPVGLRNKVWQVLVEEGVDYLNGDDLRAMTTMDWGNKAHGSWLG
ncbi:Altered inheritance of mitochondria protein 6 [Kalmusia sp. IMI 367209]|nr:Altered inheritance of mitochondria protein 6 [Kalmusia sp. IMI 367209]